jgi:hypothetical protein
MNPEPAADPAVCVPPLSGVCPICRVGPGDLPSRRFFEALKHGKPGAETGAPPADETAREPQAATDDSAAPRRSGDSSR